MNLVPQVAPPQVSILRDSGDAPGIAAAVGLHTFPAPADPTMEVEASDV